MAEEVLVKEPLTREMIEAGEEFMRVLQEGGFALAALFWLYTSEANDWKLTVVSPQVDTKGPLSTYATIRQLLAKAPHSVTGLDPFAVTVLSPKEPLVMAIAGANAIHDLTGRRMTRANFGGTYVEDMYVYFIGESIRAYISSFSYERPKTSHE
ncbi:MAG TPA: hypothetical protein VJ183_01335 [Chloroflexia bacterium]|nr:hypothetical protein [Chloroflexia bacterium]